MKKVIFLVLLVILFNTSCNKKNTMETNKEKNSYILDNNMVDDLLTKRIYFGHMSVGKNILNGVSRYVSKNNLNLNIIETLNDEYLDSDKGYLYHSNIGKNGNPISKISDFQGKLDTELSDKIDIAIFKFCYIDFKDSTDVENVFNIYTSTLDSLSHKYPNITFAHATVPLRALQGGLKGMIKKLIGKSIGVEDNIARNKFNALLKSRYHNKSLIFDIAQFESTKPDGEREFIKTGNDTCFTLAKEYTYDGGHLNAIGEDYMAKKLLIFLSQISK